MSEMMNNNNNIAMKRFRSKEKKTEDQLAALDKYLDNHIKIIEDKRSRVIGQIQVILFFYPISCIIFSPEL